MTTPTISDEEFADFLISIDEEPFKKQVRLTKKFIAKVVAEHITPEKFPRHEIELSDSYYEKGWNACHAAINQNTERELR